jgi:hypothetical protein
LSEVCCRQVRVAGFGGIIGFDLAAVAQVASHAGCDPQAVELLAHSIEPAMVDAFTEKRPGKGEDGDLIGEAGGG